MLFVKVFREFDTKMDFIVIPIEASMYQVTNEFRKPDKRRVAFERAQDARRAMTVSPRERQRQKWRAALRWIHGWGQSTSTIVARACRSSSTSFIKDMREAGLVRHERVLGRTFVLLTKQGLDLLRSMSSEEDALAALHGTRTVNLYAFSHDQDAQRILSDKLHEGGDGCQWWCDRQLRALLQSNVPGAKSPDAAFKDRVGGLVYIEVEKTRKPQPELETMLLNLARLIEEKPLARVEIHISEGIVGRYKSTLGGWLSRGEFRAWSLDTDDELYQQGIYPLTETLQNALRRIEFFNSKEAL